MTSPADRDSAVARILSLILERPVAPGEAVLRAHEPSWDSLKHLELVFMVEDEFGIALEEADMAAIDSADSLKAVISARSLTDAA